MTYEKIILGIAVVFIFAALLSFVLFVMRRKKHRNMSTAKKITITCICGKSYYSNGDRYSKCSSCGHVWDLTPSWLWSKPHLFTSKKQRQLAREVEQQDKLANERRIEEARLAEERRKEEIRLAHERRIKEAAIVEEERRIAANRQIRTFKELIELQPYQFELFIVNLFKKHHGWEGDATPPTNDEGIDAIMRNKDGTKILIQCKRYKDTPVGRDDLYALNGVVSKEKASRGYFVTTSVFTKKAKKWAKGTKIFLIDKYKLVEMIRAVFPTVDGLPDFGSEMKNQAKDDPTLWPTE
ncbi:MAG TPA: restriction endonuclease [Phycisphaerae bacterium]|nr:restriction endonuclease [Phycisphaerae bacterium]